MSNNSSSHRKTHNHPAISTENLLSVGWVLVPIPYGEKGPTTKNWNLRHNCVASTLQTSLLAGLNIGLAHAYCTPTPTCALDIDHYKHANDWLEMQGIDLDVLLKASDAVVIWSGKKYSIKLLFRLPSGLAPLESKKIIGPDGKTALEFRCATKDGKTVQDVLPPSRHPDGRDYVWVGNGNPLLLPEIKTDVLLAWQKLISNSFRVATRRDGFNSSNHFRPATPRQIATIQAALSHIDADCDYETWRNIVWAIQSTGWLCAEDIAFAWSQTAPNRFEDDAFWLVANSFIPDHPKQITVGSIYRLARIGGWNG
jgi:hypothetical protein